jgi:hypothetical protein
VKRLEQRRNHPGPPDEREARSDDRSVGRYVLAAKRVEEGGAAGGARRVARAQGPGGYVVIVGILPQFETHTHDAARMGAGRRSAHHPPDSVAGHAHVKRLEQRRNHPGPPDERETRSDDGSVGRYVLAPKRNDRARKDPRYAHGAAESRCEGPQAHVWP